MRLHKEEKPIKLKPLNRIWSDDVIIYTTELDEHRKPATEGAGV